MSFRLFIYYCMLIGAWSAFFGWVLAFNFAPSNEFAKAAIYGLFLGLSIALGLGAVDAFANLPFQQLGQILVRIFAAILLGMFGGLLGAVIGMALYGLFPWEAFNVFGRTLMAMLVGASICTGELFLSLVNRESNIRVLLGKLGKCVVGGTIGGLIGSMVASFLKVGISPILFAGRDVDRLVTPNAVGFVLMGACIGLLVGWAQVLLKEAWIRVEAGFRPGREMILSKQTTVIGRAEGSDLALFGDSGIEKQHAFLIQEGRRFYVEDQGTPGGTEVNGERVIGRRALVSGDLITLGKSRLRFFERAKNR